MTRIAAIEANRQLTNIIRPATVETPALEREVRRAAGPHVRTPEEDAAFFTRRREIADDSSSRPARYGRTGRIEIPVRRPEQVAERGGDQSAAPELSAVYVEDSNNVGSGSLYFSNGFMGTLSANSDRTKSFTADGGFKGLMMENGKGIAYNEETQKAYQFELSSDGNLMNFSAVAEANMERVKGIVDPYFG